MATWKPSVAVSDIRGLLGNQVYSFQGGSHYIKTHNANPNQPDSAAQQTVKGHFSDLSAWWHHLTDTQQRMWEKYASLQNRPLSGFNAFLSTNMSLYNSGIPSPARRDNPPLTPDTPEFPRGFALELCSPTFNFLSWTSPTNAALYVQAWTNHDWNYYSGYNQMWTILSATVSTALQYGHKHNTPTDARIWYRLRSLDLWGRKSPFTHTIKITVPPPCYFLCDTMNHRIMKRLTATHALDSQIGSQGSGDDQFEQAFGITADDPFLYIGDTLNHRIQKRRKSNLAFVAKTGSQGSGDDQFDRPYAIAVDDTDTFISDAVNHRIKKHLKSDLSYVAKIGTQGAGNDQFELPTGIAVDDTHIFICDTFNHRIKKHLKSDLSYVAKIGTQGAGNDQFNEPLGIAVDDTHIFISDTFNHRVQKRLKSDLSYVAKIGTQGTGNDQFNEPLGIAVDDTHIFVSEYQNDRVQKRLKSDLSYVSKLGSSGTGDNQFDHPAHIALYN